MAMIFQKQECRCSRNSSISRNYSFTDPDIARENNYYRLKQMILMENMIQQNHIDK